MEDRYTPDYSRIKRRIIAALIMEFALMVLLFFVYLYTYRSYRDIALANDLASVFIGCLTAHFIMSVLFTILSFRKKIKSIEVTDKDFVINGLAFEGRLDPDNMRGTGINFTGGIIPFIIPSVGTDIVVLSSDSKGKRIKKNYWTGPVFDKDAKSIRKEVMDQVRKAAAVLNDVRYSEVKAAVKQRPVTVKIDKTKYRKDKIKVSSIVFSFALLIILGSILLNEGFILTAFSISAGLLIAGYWISILIKTNRNKGDLISKLELTSDALMADDTVFDLNKLDADIFCVGKDTGEKSSIRVTPPTKETPLGIFMDLSDGTIKKRCWLGPSLDSEAAAAIMLVRYARRIVKES